MEEAKRVAHRCIERIQRVRKHCIADIHRHCRRCVKLLTELEEPELAARVKKACAEASKTVNDKAARAIKAIRGQFS